NGVREANTLFLGFPFSEPFLDFNNNNAFDGPSGNFTGLLCNGGCDSLHSLSVRAESLIIMSSSSAIIQIAPGLIDLSSRSFRVVDSNNVGVPNQDVLFSLSTTVGGITLVDSCVQTDASGNAVAQVRSGSIHTTLRVDADVRASTDGSCSGADTGLTQESGL